jgi:hypothetical protein
VEGQISLRLPPPLPVNAPSVAKQAGNSNDTNAVKGVDTLTVSIISTGGGGVDFGVGERRVPSLRAMEAELEKIFADKANPFEQVIIQVSGDVMYSDLLHVIEACAKQKLPDGTKLSKLSFVEVPSR